MLCAGDTENSKQPGFYVEPDFTLSLEHAHAGRTRNRGKTFRFFLCRIGVRWARLELAQDYSHYPLKVACLPFHHHRVFELGLQRYDKKFNPQIFLQKF